MKPLQIWLPVLVSRLSEARRRRDCQRALEAWNGESTVWLLPGLDKSTRWHESPERMALAIPAEELEQIDLFHVNGNGSVLGRNSRSVFPTPFAGLLDAWLNCSPASADLDHPPKALPFEIPVFSQHQVRYEQIELTPKPYGMMTIRNVEGSPRTVRAGWPPEGLHLRTVSPDAESAEMYGPFQRSDIGDVASGISSKTGDRTWFTFARWPKPFDTLIPPADGVDVFLGHAKMVKVARLSETDLSQAVIIAKQEASEWVFQGIAVREQAWFWPTYIVDGEEAVLFGAQDYGVSARSIGELFKNADFRRIMSERIEIRRAWGPLGLFWALLLEKLESRQSFSSCQNCGRLIQGKKGKRLCGSTDNLKCFSQRRAADQRRSRSRRK
jgi:hypothetical protein